mgnify:CR=1 FL=1
MQLKVYKHVPPHLFIDGAIYFVSCSTYRKLKIFDSADKKKLLLDTISAIIKKYGCDLHAWVVLDNHYHLLFQAKNARAIPSVFQKIRGGSSFEINRIDNVRGRKVWYNYWDECVRDERDYYNKLNYIHLNSVKHGYAEKPEDYEFSSYRAYLEANGEEWLSDILARYPVSELLRNDR